MAEDLQDSNKKRLFYSLINIEAQSLSVNGQTLVFQDHTLIIVSEGQGWLEAEEKRFPWKRCRVLVRTGAYKQNQCRGART